jgi:hypothetical protein
MASPAARLPEDVRPATRRAFVFWFILVGLVVAVTEALAALASVVLVGRGAMADVPRLTADEIALALAHRNALGWGPEIDAAGRVVRLAPRSDPAFPAEHPPCVATYGDSFTLGAADEATWPHTLARALGCPVANYGVGGYGSDQALMLFRAQRHLDRAPVVVLAHLTENVMRNVNQYQRLLYPASRLRFKPRFALEGDALRTIPTPVATAADYRAVADAPAAILHDDAFLARPRPRFPYTLQLLRWLATDSYARSRLLRRPWHAAFYRPDDPSDALRLTTRILARFVEEARADGRTGVLVVIPTRSDLDYARRTGRWVDQSLVDALRARGLPLVDVGPPFLARIHDADLGTLFVADGHPNARGYALLGEVIAEGMPRPGPS